MPFLSEAGSRPGMRSDQYSAIAYLGLSLLLTAFYFHKDIFPLDRVGNLGDGAQCVWNLWIVDWLIAHGQNPFFTTLAYWPVGTNLSHHSLNSGYYPFTLIFRLIWGNDISTYIFAYNVFNWVALSLVWFFTFQCLRIARVPAVPSIFAAIAFAFGTYFRLNSQALSHVAFFFFPLCCFLSARLFIHARKTDLYLIGIFSALSVYFMDSLAVMFPITMAFTVMALIISAETRQRVLHILIREPGLRHFAIAGLLSILVALPMLWAFFATPNYPSDLSEQALHSADLGTFFLGPPSWNLLYPAWVHSLSNAIPLTSVPGTAFLGFPAVALTLVALILRPQRFVYIAFGAALLFGIAGLGPYLKAFGFNTGIALPYKFVFEHGLLPSFRTPDRFPVVTMFFFAILSGVGLAALMDLKFKTDAVGRISKITLVAVFGFWLAAEQLIDWPSPNAKKLAWVVPPDMRAVAPGSVLMLPHLMIHGYIGLAQVVHHQPTLTGAVVRLSPEMNDQWWKIHNALEKGSDQIKAMLEQYQVRTIILMPHEGIPENLQETEIIDKVLVVVQQMPGIKVIDDRAARQAKP